MTLASCTVGQNTFWESWFLYWCDFTSQEGELTTSWVDKIRIDHFLVPMQCTGNSGCFSLGRANSHSMALPRFSPLCAVFSCFHTTVCEAYSFTVNGCRIFNVRTNLGACRTHEWRSGTNKSAQMLTRKRQKNRSSPYPARGSNAGIFPWWSLCTLYLPHASWNYRRRLGSLLCAYSMCDVNCSSAITSHCLLIVQGLRIWITTHSDLFNCALSHGDNGNCAN